MKDIKKAIKVTIILILLTSLALGVTILIEINLDSKVYAARNSSISDLQLLARAINGEARGEPYEGQVAVRSSYIKSCKKS